MKMTACVSTKLDVQAGLAETDHFISFHSRISLLPTVYPANRELVEQPWCYLALALGLESTVGVTFLRKISEYQFCWLFFRKVATLLADSSYKQRMFNENTAS